MEIQAAIGSQLRLQLISHIGSAVHIANYKVRVGRCSKSSLSHVQRERIRLTSILFWIK
jgi:hypothetical protein